MTGGYVIREFGPSIHVVKASLSLCAFSHHAVSVRCDGCWMFRLAPGYHLISTADTGGSSIERRNDMDLQIRRVLTGHNADGRAVVKIDETCRNLISTRKGQQSCVVWTTDTAPADNDTDEDASQRPVGTTLAGGTVFRIVRYDPGVAPRNHRTDSIDYAVVLAGEIDMELDGATAKLKAGDVLVQRGTIHNWVNRSSEPCIIAFVLVDAKPVVAGARRLDATG
jgi:quercetin dioxygenase-like cupin family protein